MRLSHRLTKQGVRWSYRDTIYWSHETDTPDSIFDSKMKINSKTALRYLVIFLAFGVKEIAGVAVTTFSCDQKAAPKESFNITCSITGTIVSGIQWIRPDGTQVITCSDPTTCGTLVSGYSITSASSSENVLQIANMGALDGGNWTCQDGPGGDKGCEIIVQKTPTFTLTIILEKKKYSVGDTLEVSVDVQDYYCSRTPSFHLLLDTQRVELDALPSTTSTTLSGTQNKSITVTEEMTGSIKLVFNCRDDDVFANKTFTIMDPTPATTETPTTVPGDTDCLIILIIIIIIIVILVLALIIFHIVIFYVKVSFKVMGILFFVNVILAVAAIIIGIVGIVAFALCEVIAAITAIVIGALTHLYKFFLSKRVLKKADVPHRHLFCGFFAYPWKTGDASGDE